MVTLRPAFYLWAGVLLLFAAVCAVGLIEYRRACDLQAKLDAATAEAQRSALHSSGAIVAKDVPAPPVPSQLRNQVDAVRRAVPDAKPERSEDVSTGWIEAKGPVLPCDQSPPHAAGGKHDDGTDRAAGTSGNGGALLRPGDRFRIHLVSVDLTTPQGATGTVGHAEVIRESDSAVILSGPLEADRSTVWRRQRPQDAPRWWATPMAGVTSRARAWAGVAIGRGRWGGVLGAAWKPGDAEYFGGVAFRW